MARQFLMERYRVEALVLYRKVLKKEGQCLGAIAGLGETGAQNDAESIVPFLESDNAKIVRFTIKALARLDPARYWIRFTPLLADQRPGIAKEAFSALRRDVSRFLDQHEVHKIFSNVTVGHGREYAALLLHGQNKWKAIPHILEACADANEVIARIGQESLARWIGRFNRTFDQPLPEQLSALVDALAKYSLAISDANKKWLQFCLKPFTPDMKA